MSENYSFNHDSADGKKLLEWAAKLATDKGMRAELRRCRCITDVMLTKSYYTALRETGAESRVNAERFAYVLGLLSHIESHDPEYLFPARMAISTDGGRPRVSGLRFRRLITMDYGDQYYQALVRVIRLLKRHVNVLSVAEGVYWWNDGTRRSWAQSYYSTSPEQI